LTTLPLDAPLSGPLRRASLAAVAAADKQAEDTVLLDVGDILSITDAFVITSAGNTRLVRTIVDEVEQALKVHEELTPRSVEGLDDAAWVLMDYGEFVVHVFLSETRAYYDLDRLWSDAPAVDWESVAAASYR
jgi:ribosome-associated protein